MSSCSSVSQWCGEEQRSDMDLLAFSVKLDKVEEVQATSVATSKLELLRAFASVEWPYSP